MKSSKNTILDKKKLLLNTVGKIVKKIRQQKRKGILLHSYEYDIPSSSLNLIERGERDAQLTTLWKIANSLGLSFGEFVSMVEKQLPEDFTLIEDK